MCATHCGLRPRTSLIEGWDPYSGAGLVQVSALGLSDPPHARVFSPAQDGVLEVDRVRVQISLGSVEEWTVAWGRGAEPETWHIIAEGSAVDLAEIDRTWDAQGLADGMYQVRLRARSGTHWLDDRVRVFLRRAEGEILGLRTSRELRAGRWRQVVEWETLRDRPGFLIVERDGMSVHEERLAPARRQRVVLPENLPAARYAVQVYSASGKRRGRRSAYRGNRSGERVGSALAFKTRRCAAQWLFASRCRGRQRRRHRRTVQMSYGRQRTYNTVDFYQQEEGL